MTLDEAIEILTIATDKGGLVIHDDLIDAEMLGIFALKLIQRERLLGINPVETELPGETKD